MNIPHRKYVEQRRRTTLSLAAIVFFSILFVNVLSTSSEQSSPNISTTKQEETENAMASEPKPTDKFTSLASQSFPENTALQTAIVKFVTENNDALSQSEGVSAKLKNAIQNVSHLQNTILDRFNSIANQPATPIPTNKGGSHNMNSHLADATKPYAEKLNRELGLLRNEKSESENELKKLKFELGKLVDKTQRQVASSVRRADLIEDYDEIRFLLKPFISHGYRQPKGGKRSTDTVDKGPVSFGLLEKHGYLERTREGLINLYCFGGAFNPSRTNNNNDRPTGTFPIYQGDYLMGQERIVEPVKRAQELLKKHGQALIEAKKLAK